MLQAPRFRHPGYRIFCISLFLLALSGQTLAACTDRDLDRWWEEGVLKSGAAVWAGADNIPVHSMATDASAIGEDLAFNTAFPILGKQKRSKRTWIRIQWKGQQPWIRADRPGVLCRSSPLRNEENGLFRKVIAWVSNQKGKQVLVRVQKRPGDRGDTKKKQELGIFDHFFVYAEHGDWRLLGRKGALYSEPDLLGWVDKSDLIRWNTRDVARAREGANFLDRPDGGQVIAKNTAENWDKHTRRPPILGSEQTESGKYLQVALPVDIEAHDRHIKNLRRLAEAADAWKKPMIVFLVDGTRSTEHYVGAIHALLGNLLKKLEQKNSKLKYALYAYTDKAYGKAYHIRRYQGATQNAESVRRAFRLLRKKTSRIHKHIHTSDDYFDDLYAGIGRVRDDALKDEEIRNTLPILIVVGNHGGHEREKSRDEIKPFMEEIVPYFIQLGRQNEDIHPQCPGDPDNLEPSEKIYCAFQRFEEDARELLGDGFELEFGQTASS